MSDAGEMQQTAAATDAGEAMNSEMQQRAAATDVTEDNKVSERTKPVKRGNRQQTRVYNCTSCSRSFNSRRDIVTHQYMHRENPTAFCSVCNKSFSTESAYRRHAASHNRKAATSRRPRKTCSQCDMQFDTMRQLSVHHAAMHVDEKRFICAVCGSQFAWPENLKAHQRSHQLDPHECQICGRRFVDATSLRVHTRNSHGPSSEALPQRKQHCCKVCGRLFQFDFSLRAHMKGHAQSPAAAASLRRSKHHSAKLASDTKPATQTKYVHVDSKGVIDLGMDVAQAAISQPSEIIVEVYNYQSDALNNGTVTTEQALDFSDVLDQSTLAHNVTETEMDSTADHTDHEGPSKLVWYVKPDAHDKQLDAQDDDLQQQQHSDDNDEDDNELDENVKSSELSVALAAVAKQNSDDVQPAAAAGVGGVGAAAGLGRDGVAEDGAAADGDVAGCEHGTHDVVQRGAVCRHDDDSQHQAHQLKVTAESSFSPVPESTGASVLAASSASASVPAVITAELTSAPVPESSGAAVPAVEAASKSASENDDDDDDEIDWMVAEPPRRRAAPFIFRHASSSRRPVTRPREPFLFNCVMTNEKPFVCMTCGQCFRWEISLVIHQRLHTDGTFPNKSRGTHNATRRPSKRRAKAKPTSPTKSSVARSCIVRHRRTSSDEDDDEFTFHVHADGPSEVSTRYPSVRQRSAAGRGRGQTRDHGSAATVSTRYTSLRRQTAPSRGRGRAQADSSVATTVVKQPAVSVSSANVTVQHQRSDARAGCNGVECERQSSKASATGAAVKDWYSKKQLALRAGYVCLHCRRVVTTLSAFNRHQRRMHFTSSLVCQFCSAHFTSRLDLLHHCQRQHDGVSSGDMRCQRCRRVFTKSKQLQQHYKLHQAAVMPARHKPLHVSESDETQ